MIEHFGISVFLFNMRQNRFFQLFQSFSMIRAYCHFLSEPMLLRPVAASTRRSIIICNCVSPQSQTIILIQNSCPGKSRSLFIGKQNILRLRIRQEITSTGMSPVHVLPPDSVRIMLMVNVINSIVINQPIGIIEPPKFWRIMDQRSFGLLIYRFFISYQNVLKPSFFVIPFYGQDMALIRCCIKPCIKTWLIFSGLNTHLLNLYSIYIKRYNGIFCSRSDGYPQIFPCNTNCIFQPAALSFCHFLC